MTGGSEARATGATSLQASGLTPHRLSNTEIEEWCERYGLNYRGMYMGDKDLERIPPGDGCYLINLDDSDGGGTHWVGVFAHQDLQCYYDPLGLYPEDVLWEKFKRLVVSDQQNQLETSVLCGYFVCLFFGVMTVSPSRKTFHDLTHEVFTDDQVENERIISEIFSGV